MTCTNETHAATKADPAAFDALQYIGEMADETDDGKPARLILRNCVCGSTLCVQDLVDE